jgi:hypothetical protein
MDRFLPAARKNFLNYLFTLTSLLAPVVVLVLLREHTDTAMFWLTLAGWLAFFTGPILGSRCVAEPLYDVMLSWTPTIHRPTGWPPGPATTASTPSAPPAHWPPWCCSWPPSPSPPRSQGCP